MRAFSGQTAHRQQARVEHALPRRASLRPSRRGLVLLEVLTVVGVLALLIAIVIPMMVKAQERSARLRCEDQLRSIGQALQIYAADHRSAFPAVSSTCEPVMPDLTNSGFNAADPFGPDGPGPHNIPAALFLLVRTCNLSPRAFVCPNTAAVADDLAGLTPLNRSNFSDIRRNLSYSIQNPYPAPGHRAPRLSGLSPDFVLMADLNPGIKGEESNVLAVTPQSSTDQMRLGNSNNHGKMGQNILFADGHVAFATDPFAGLNGDNIYTTKSNTIVDFPADAEDTILLPVE